MKFRPCIDLHEGKVKQIIGGTLDAGVDGRAIENFVSERGAAFYAEMYKRADLPGGHVIMLGPGNETEAVKALKAYPGGLQVGGGINAENADGFLEAGASHVIASSFVFGADGVNFRNLGLLVAAVGKNRLTLDLSCRKVGEDYFVAVDKWRTITPVMLNADLLNSLSGSCAEFLIHAVDMEGKIAGVDEELISALGEWGRKPVTYAGGVASFEDLEKMRRLGKGKVDVSIGSALDIFGGGLSFEKIVDWFRSE